MKAHEPEMLSMVEHNVLVIAGHVRIIVSYR